MAKNTRLLQIPMARSGEVERALDLILTSTYFNFDGKRYRQIEGSPMGNPLSPFFAEVVMRDLETSCMKKLNFKPLVYFRYVDDIFCIVPVDKVDHMKEIFEKYHTKIRFTSEMEKHKFLSF